MTSKAEEIYGLLVMEFPEAMQSLSELSRNEQGRKDFIRSDVKAFNFDKLWNIGGGKKCKEKSPDALFCHGETLYFIEFKEGGCDRADVRQKIHEGILSLFQYSVSKGVANRDSFFGIKIKYAVVKRSGAQGEVSFLQALERSQDVFSLKNIEGLLVKETAVRWVPDSIFKLLNKVSGGAIDRIDVVASDQKTVVVCM
ncbi:hypothetical protein [uncultured Zoogloea sp.]|uniref:hypothetical protein n=1 Tax=uncultured Zoogloea sp. TaxID=160237 RepID=UPI002609CD1D|nr:hypothetical protein [uncultured Zoogloea sp.]